MSRCRHPELLLPQARPRLQCRRCGLTITAEELGGGPCPECLDVSGEPRREFEAVSEDPAQRQGYRCTSCGASIGWK